MSKPNKSIMFPNIAMPQLTCLTPQMLRGLVESMQQFQANGMHKAAADVAHLLGQCSLCSLPPSPPPYHVCPLNFPPPPAMSSPGQRRRRRRRSSALASRLNPSHLSTSKVIRGKLTLQQFREFDIMNMSATIDCLAPGNQYHPYNSASTPSLSQRRRCLTPRSSAAQSTTSSSCGPVSSCAHPQMV